MNAFLFPQCALPTAAYGIIQCSPIMNRLGPASGVLDYWRTVELFAPQAVPRLAPRDRTEPVFMVDRSSGMPWEPAGHTLRHQRPPVGRTWRHTVYCGVFPLSKMREILEEKLGRDPESFDERIDGESCLFAFSVSDEGRPLFDTFVVSTCAWAVGRTLSPGPDAPSWLSGFDELADDLTQRFKHRFALEEGDQRGQQLESWGFVLGRPVTWEDIRRETIAIAEELGTSFLSAEPEIRVKSILVARKPLKRQYAADDQDFLNSFFVKDLTRVARALDRSEQGAGLTAYLSTDADIDPCRRVDVRASLPELREQLAPAHIPPGRWPAKHPLVFSQQLAVNAMLRELGESSGLFAVNGPPGTGKTTLLRDLIAAIVVERARRLSRLSTPEKAFTTEGRWKSGKFTRVVSLWREDLRGFEIVVASNNNGAVENVTLEIPGREAIDARWEGQVDYFAEHAERLIEQPAWALTAARLGNKSNRYEFLQRFWHGKKKQRSDRDDNEQEDVTSNGFRALLRSFAEEQVPDWGQAVRRFQTTLREEGALRSERSRWYEALLKSEHLREQAIPEADLLLHGAEDQRNRTWAHLEEALRRQREAEDRVARTQQRRLDHRQFRPGWLEIVLSVGRAFRDWRREDRSFAAELRKAQDEQEESTRSAVEGREEVERIDAELRRRQGQRDHLRALLREESDLLAVARRELGDAFPDPVMWSADAERRETSSPWIDERWNDARAKVFLEALNLHKVFITICADRLRKSLDAAADVLGGGVPEAASRDAVAAAWTALFFVIPVVSTTFASFDRLFSHLGREALGWLLIDEAGQAAPQSAVGAVWRARRAVVVGDPLQLEPVVTLPFTAQQSLRRHHRVAETWLPMRTSAQQLADRTARLGTYLAGEEGPLWVGAPLRVHRRCDQPMFDISNRIAYDGLMVWGTPRDRRPLPLPPSCWIDVVTATADSHWNPEEGRAVLELLRDLAGRGHDLREIFLISPFRVVARNLRALIAEHAELAGLRAGTIHTAQGKESDVVILVLGGDPQRPGAKKWASQRPNLLNVAVSRARRRLYVIGDRQSWKGFRYFSELARQLPHPAGGRMPPA